MNYWQTRLTNLSDEIPAWSACFQNLDQNYLGWLAETMTNTNLYGPNASDVFRSLLDLRPEQVRVVILGQDPYPDINAACGRAFAVRGGKIPASLRTIMTHLNISDPTLECLVQQGVLLINASPVLSDFSGKENQPWRPFTGTILAHLASLGVAFVFMGKLAQSYTEFVPASRVVSLPHPAARGGQFAAAMPYQTLANYIPEINW